MALALDSSLDTLVKIVPSVFYNYDEEEAKEGKQRHWEKVAYFAAALSIEKQALSLSSKSLKLHSPATTARSQATLRETALRSPLGHALHPKVTTRGQTVL